MIKLGVGNVAEECKMELFFPEKIACKKDALCCAIEECKDHQDCYDLVNNLLIFGFEINREKMVLQEFLWHQDPLLLAIAMKKLDIVQILINAGVNINGVFGRSPLLKAVEDNFFDGICLLLRYGADPNFYKDNLGIFITPPLYKALMNKNLDAASVLLDHGANVHVKISFTFVDEKGSTHYTEGSPILKLVDDNFFDGVVLLLRYGANPLDGSSPKGSPLDFAIRKGYYDIIDVLLDAALREQKAI